MPMNFPDMQSLERAAEVWKFRKLNDNETEEHYRSALADFVAPKDFIESEEIRMKVGWDKWNEDQGKSMLARAFLRNL